MLIDLAFMFFGIVLAAIFIGLTVTKINLIFGVTGFLVVLVLMIFYRRLVVIEAQVSTEQRGHELWKQEHPLLVVIFYLCTIVMAVGSAYFINNKYLGLQIPVVEQPQDIHVELNNRLIELDRQANQMKQMMEKMEGAIASMESNTLKAVEQNINKEEYIKEYQKVLDEIQKNGASILSANEESIKSLKEEISKNIAGLDSLAKEEEKIVLQIKNMKELMENNNAKIESLQRELKEFLDQQKTQKQTEQPVEPTVVQPVEVEEKEKEAQ